MRMESNSASSRSQRRVVGPGMLSPESKPTVFRVVVRHPVLTFLRSHLSPTAGECSRAQRICWCGSRKYFFLVCLPGSVQYAFVHVWNGNADVLRLVPRCSPVSRPFRNCKQLNARFRSAVFLLVLEVSPAVPLSPRQEVRPTGKIGSTKSS